MTTQAQQSATLAYDSAAIFSQGRATMSETDWNWHIRQSLHKQGYRALHVREANETGVADLLVYRSLLTSSGAIVHYQVIEAWLELKVVRIGETGVDLIKPGQREFMRDHWRIGRNAMFAFYDRTVDMLEVRQGDLKGRVKMYKPNPYAINWQEVFAHFKARKVAL